MRPIIIGFGLLILCLLILFKISEVNFIKGNVRLEVIVTIAAHIGFIVAIISSLSLMIKKPIVQRAL